MSAVWRASRAAVKRRRLQTFVLGLVVLISTMTVVVTLGLLAAVSGPFDKVYGAAKGAHVVAEFDRSRVTDEQLARAAKDPAVAAVAGPFPQLVFHQSVAVSARPLNVPGIMTVVGRADPEGPVDDLTLSVGRWPSAPDEIVLGQSGLFTSIILPIDLVTPGRPTLHVVGIANSASGSADAWVTPDEARALGATSTQMQYRFRSHGTAADLRAGLAAATKGLPADALTGSHDYLALKAKLASGPGVYLPFLTVFGILGLIVSVLIVGNVVSGAVVSGFRHIGILKSLGFTPGQVTAVYLLIVTLPAVVGCVLGTILGSVLGDRLVNQVFYGIQGAELINGAADVPPTVYPTVLIGMPAVVVLAALMPALRARRLPAAVAISAGSAPRAGRGLAVQRRLAGSGLPRAVSLGLGWPFARPARTLLTLSAVVVGVTTVTLAIGMTGSTFKFGELHRRTDQVYFTAGAGSPGNPAPTHTDAQIDAILRAQPGVVRVAADAPIETHIAGSTAKIWAGVTRGDYGAIQAPLVTGRWATAPGEVTVDSEYVHEFGFTVGETIRMLDASGKEVPETIVGEGPGWHIATPDWQSFIGLNQQGRAATFYVTLGKGADAAAVIAAVDSRDPGLHGSVDGESKTSEKIFLSIITTLTIMLSIVASLGVMNTVLLNTRERRRDLGMLKAIGMTPGQVVAMVVTAMTALGAVGGLVGVPLGMLAHRIVIPLTMHGMQDDAPDSMLHVWNWAGLVLLVLSGAAIAAMGAFLPSIQASRASVAEVLRTE